MGSSMCDWGGKGEMKKRTPLKIIENSNMNY
jgi:hypothetical protein